MANQSAKKSGLATAAENFAALVEKYDVAEERKSIEATLDTMQEYFAAVQKAEAALEEAVSTSTEADAPEDASKR